MTDESEQEQVAEALEPVLIAVEKYVVELMRLSRQPGRMIESAAHSDAGYLRQVRRDAINAIFSLRKYAP